MQALRFLFSPHGRLSPQPFAIAVIIIYLAGVASQALTVPDVIARAGLWPFVALQALLLWIWFALHAKRLRDAGRGIGLALGVGLLYALSVALLILVAASFVNAADMPDANTAGALGLILFVSVVTILLGSPHYDIGWIVAAVLLITALVPVVVAVIFSAWTATRPHQDQEKL
jgi:uncharacterized membrane protein YhaH (DUF805 family)